MTSSHRAALASAAVENAVTPQTAAISANDPFIFSSLCRKQCPIAFKYEIVALKMWFGNGGGENKDDVKEPAVKGLACHTASPRVRSVPQLLVADMTVERRGLDG